MRIGGTFLAFICVIPFFWLYFDSIDAHLLSSSKKNKSVEFNVAYLQTCHAWLILGLVVMATALHGILMWWNCELLSDDPTTAYLPIPLQFYFSVPLAIAAYARGMVTNFNVNRDMELSKLWFTNSTFLGLTYHCWYHTFLSLTFLCLPFFCGYPNVASSTLLAAAATLSVLTVVLDVVFYSYIEANHEGSQQNDLTEVLVSTVDPPPLLPAEEEMTIHEKKEAPDASETLQD